ncbi:hypothetical protein [Streptomyces macrosporus]|uniref:V8-like Glu-specific endopeptidase n=1 Tax=Streptomyces macrosporus TaxID=44032 RepID=A0ABN3K444_9ACTN
MSSIRRRRSAPTAVAMIAVLAVAATACGPTDGETDAKARPGASAQDGDNADVDDLGLPEELPDALKDFDLDKWKDGEWRNWDEERWLREAKDFVNPVIEGLWKPDRMKEAEDNTKTVSTNAGADQGATDPEPAPVEAEPVKTPYHRNAAPVGKVFMDTPQGAMVCSGTVVEDPRNPGKSNLVATAGHCVHAGKEGGWFRNIAFVPAYNDKGHSSANVDSAPYQDVAPYGVYWATWAQTTDYWISQGTESGGGGAQEDFAVLHVQPEQKTGKSLEETVGAALPINFDAPEMARISGVSNYGYPAAPPYDGVLMYTCTDRPTRLTIDPSAPTMYRIGCTMTGGSSGGSWLAEGPDGEPEIVSVTSIGSRPASWLAGPYLGPSAEAVYEAISEKFAGRS